MTDRQAIDHPGGEQGFTLPELMIAPGIVAILLMAAVHGVGSLMKNNNLSNQLNSIVTDIYLARSEAVLRNVRVIMCRSNNPNSSNPVCGGAEKVWTGGYLVFADDGNYTNNIYDIGKDTLLRRGQPALSGVKMRTNRIWNRNLEFNPNGTTNEGEGIARMSLCDNRGRHYGRQIQVNPIGMPRMYSTPVANCSP